MRPLIGERDALLMRYLMVFLIGYVLFTIHAGADNRKKANAADSVPYIEPGKARLVDLASLPPQLRRTVDDEIRRQRAGDGVLVSLHEWAYAADGGGVLGVRELDAAPGRSHRMSGGPLRRRRRARTALRAETSPRMPHRYGHRHAVRVSGRTRRTRRRTRPRSRPVCARRHARPA